MSAFEENECRFQENKNMGIGYGGVPESIFQVCKRCDTQIHLVGQEECADCLDATRVFNEEVDAFQDIEGSEVSIDANRGIVTCGVCDDVGLITKYDTFMWPKCPTCIAREEKTNFPTEDSVFVSCSECGYYPCTSHNYDGKCEPCWKKDNPDMVNHPEHYANHGVEVIQVIQDKLKDSGVDPYVGYLLGNIYKYVLRCPFKGRMLEDLKKAEFYLQRAIEELEEN